MSEELRAANEALAAQNNELQATVARLSATNQRLKARSAEARKMLRDSERGRSRLETLLSSMADAALLVDPTGRIDLANEAARRMFGSACGLQELLDQDGRELAPEETPQYRAARGERFQLEFARSTNDGLRFFEAIGGPIEAGGENQGGVVVVRDITDRSVRLLQDEFLALASHELRNPLTVLQSSLQLLVRRLDSHPNDTESLRYRTETALRQARQLGRLVSDLVNTARLQKGKYRLELAVVRLDRLVAAMVDSARPTAQGQYIAFSGPDALTVTADAGRLEQVVANVIRNAIVYAPNTARIDVRVRQVGETAVIEVEDYGGGIAATDLPYLFTRFYQVARNDRPSRSGLGLGLYISQQIVEAHKGQIGVESEEGKGTTFRIVLPLVEAADPLAS